MTYFTTTNTTEQHNSYVACKAILLRIGSWLWNNSFLAVNFYQNGILSPWKDRMVRPHSNPEWTEKTVFVGNFVFNNDNMVENRNYIKSRIVFEIFTVSKHNLFLSNSSSQKAMKSQAKKKKMFCGEKICVSNKTTNQHQTEWLNAHWNY